MEHEVVMVDQHGGMVVNEEHEMVMGDHDQEMVMVDQTGQMNGHQVVMEGHEMVMEGHEMVMGDMTGHNRKKRHDEPKMARHAGPLYCSKGSVIT